MGFRVQWPWVLVAMGFGGRGVWVMGRRRGCRQNGLWWVWVCRRGYGGCGFGFAAWVWGLWVVADEWVLGFGWLSMSGFWVVAVSCSAAA
uniref:Transmembrane protein n=1 Tax=Fagus sylvatica TaxID=28930 RepID=A0A2N9EMM9_FAGSY